MAGNFRSLLARGWPLALALYLLAAGYAIHAHGPLPLYSTRSLSVAWEMWLRGEFIVPYLNGAAYAHKVPLLYWLIHAGWAVGGVSDTCPRVLMLLIGSANLLLLAWFCRRLQPGQPRAAALAPWLLLGSAFWFVYCWPAGYCWRWARCCAAGRRRRGRTGGCTRWRWPAAC
jgi:4-amino-4-deoxy-L-arabinose transferase-like glycosyltransferase